MSLRCQNGLKCYPDRNLIEHQWIVLDKQAGGPTSEESLKIPERTFRQLCRSSILGGSVFLAAHRGPTQYWAGGRNVVTDWCR